KSSGQTKAILLVSAAPREAEVQIGGHLGSRRNVGEVNRLLENWGWLTVCADVAMPPGASLSPLRRSHANRKARHPLTDIAQQHTTGNRLTRKNMLRHVDIEFQFPQGDRRSYPGYQDRTQHCSHNDVEQVVTGIESGYPNENGREYKHRSDFGDIIIKGVAHLRNTNAPGEIRNRSQSHDRCQQQGY